MAGNKLINLAKFAKLCKEILVFRLKNAENGKKNQILTILNLDYWTLENLRKMIEFGEKKEATQKICENSLMSNAGQELKNNEMSICIRKPEQMSSESKENFEKLRIAEQENLKLYIIESKNRLQDMKCRVSIPCKDIDKLIYESLFLPPHDHRVGILELYVPKNANVKPGDDVKISDEKKDPFDILEHQVPSPAEIKTSDENKPDPLGIFKHHVQSADEIKTSDEKKPDPFDILEHQLPSAAEIKTSDEKKPDPLGIFKHHVQSADEIKTSNEKKQDPFGILEQHVHKNTNAKLAVENKVDALHSDASEKLVVTEEKVEESYKKPESKKNPTTNIKISEIIEKSLTDANQNSAYASTKLLLASQKQLTTVEKAADTNALPKISENKPEVSDQKLNDANKKFGGSSEKSLVAVKKPGVVLDNYIISLKDSPEMHKIPMPSAITQNLERLCSQNAEKLLKKLSKPGKKSL